MSDTISPEERLFKVIQQGKLTAGKEGGAGEKKTGGWLGKFKFFTKAQAAGVAGAEGKEGLLARIKWPELEPEIINKVLAVVLVVLVIAALVASGKRKDVSAITSAAARLKTSPEEGKKKIEPLKKISSYLSEMRKRDIFHASTETPAAGIVQKKSETLVKAAESLKLQGISWGDIPKAMILWQDGKDNKMYFLVEGQPIGTTGLKVIEISRSTVKVGDGKEETVLL